MKPRCQHCQQNKACRPRKLCNACYDDLAIRHQYAPIENHAPLNETEADLDALIAEQSKPENLPPWWPHCIRYGESPRETDRPRFVERDLRRTR